MNYKLWGQWIAAKRQLVEKLTLQALDAVDKYGQTHANVKQTRQ
jgi:hypothetical protein